MKKTPKHKRLKYPKEDTEYHPKLALIRLGLVIITILLVHFGFYFFSGGEFELFNQKPDNYMYEPDKTIEKTPKEILNIYELKNIETNETIGGIQLISINNETYLDVINLNDREKVLVYLSSNMKGQNSYIIGEINVEFATNKFKITDEMNIEMRKYLLYIDKDTRKILSYTEIN